MAINHLKFNQGWGAQEDIMSNTLEESEASKKRKLIAINIRFVNLLRKEYNNVINDRIDDAGKVVQIRQRD